MLFSTVFNWTFRSRKNFCSLQNKLHGIMANKLQRAEAFVEIFPLQAQVTLFDYIGADLQLKTGEVLKTHFAFSGVVELAFGIPFIFELVLPVEGVFGVYLDFGGSGTLAQPYKVMESLVKFSNEVTLEWGVVIQVSLRPQLAVLGFEFNFPVSAKFQAQISTNPGGPGGCNEPFFLFQKSKSAMGIKRYLQSISVMSVE